MGTTVSADGSLAITDETSTAEVQEIYADLSLQNADGSFNVEAANELLVSGNSSYDLNDLIAAIALAGGGVSLITAVEAAISDPDSALSDSQKEEISEDVAHTYQELIDNGNSSLQAAYDNFVAYLGSEDAEAAGISTDLASEVQAFLDQYGSDSSTPSVGESLNLLTREELRTAMHATAMTGNVGLGTFFSLIAFNQFVVEATDATNEFALDGFDEIQNLMDENLSLDSTDAGDQAIIQVNSTKISQLTNAITTAFSIQKAMSDAYNKIAEIGSDEVASTWQTVGRLGRNIPI